MISSEMGWGTWEELLLGGAVLRHGTRDWDTVASELRARTRTRSLCPLVYTPEVCKAKYEALQQRYAGSAALFEELRKQRMAELKRALELSEDSIGSLESKLEILKAERADEFHVFDSCQTESPFQRSHGNESSSKETSKDGLSAGSFTEETRTNWPKECRALASFSAEDIKLKPEVVSELPVQDKFVDIGKLAEVWVIKGVSIRRRRGKRKRKDCRKDVKEGSVGETEFLGSADVLSATHCKDTSTSSSHQVARCSTMNDQCRGYIEGETVDLLKIFESIAENKCASVFRRRLDSQKRGRYKKMILQHMDFDTIRSRIVSQSIISAKELFRDLLLLASNALVFYSKTTREYKSALLLRDIVTNSLRHHLKEYISRTTITLLSTIPSMLNPPVKPRSAHSAYRKLPVKVVKAGEVVAKTPNGGKRPTNAHSPPLESLVVMKKGSGRPRKAACGGTTQQAEIPAKGRKRVRAK
ncbi:hypothetical protein K2173_001493 [Erythroxylum novogranatense]|uniref:Bromo domain-containing protein n=1 Tax=Erythroxylum novogranatense TaxID=1862640 RepID=A0AAV8T579_9ROSI|nr:hypothetical protein K2173_001493 [Erythroxylum novogranatense]